MLFCVHGGMGGRWVGCQMIRQGQKGGYPTYHYLHHVHVVSSPSGNAVLTQEMSQNCNCLISEQASKPHMPCGAQAIHTQVIHCQMT